MYACAQISVDCCRSAVDWNFSREFWQSTDCTGSRLLSPSLKLSVDWWFDQSTGRRCRVLERVSNRVLTKGIDGGDWLDVLWMDRIVLRDY